MKKKQQNRQTDKQTNFPFFKCEIKEKGRERQIRENSEEKITATIIIERNKMEYRK